MRHEIERKNVGRNNGIRVLQRWLRWPFKRIEEGINNKKGSNEMQGLSEHLLDDLGFDRNGQPLQWSSFTPEESKPVSLRLSRRDRDVCLQSRPGLQKTVVIN